MRLIDSDRLLKELGQVWNIPEDWDGDIDETCETAFTIIENQTTVYEMNEKIMELIDKFSEKHKLAKVCGSEYIYQSDRAQVDALELVGDIFDLYAEEYEDDEDE